MKICDHIEIINGHVFNKKHKVEVSDGWTHCPFCGAQCLAEEDELDEILKGFRIRSEIRVDLIVWRDKAVKAEFNRMAALKEILDETNRPASSAKEMYDHGYLAGRNDEKIVQENKPASSGSGKETLCHHCNTAVAIRNLLGYCDHLYYPENCKVCSGSGKDKPTNLREVMMQVRSMYGKGNGDRYWDLQAQSVKEWFKEMIPDAIPANTFAHWNSYRQEVLRRLEGA